MRLAEILLKPILSEKSNKLQEKRGIYSFKVARKANKLEIKNAVQSFYGVNVAEVRTMVVPSKSKSKMTKSGVISGRKPGYKKALVTVAEGETIDLYTNV
jgi:large subunit ribosomal protein L23